MTGFTTEYYDCKDYFQKDYYGVFFFSGVWFPTMTTTSDPNGAGRKRRSPENMVTSFSIPRDLLEQAKQMAREEKRPVSNLIAKLLEDELSRRAAARK